LNPDVRAPRPWLSALLTALLTALLLGIGGPVMPAARADPILPPLPTAPEGDIPGVNVWTCKPTAARPTPVIIVHGTFGDRRHLLERLGKSIRARGFCVYALDYGNRGINDVAKSAEQLRAFVTRVRRATGAAKVSMVGHSQGGMMPRYYIKFLGGAQYVDDLVGLAPSNHGTKLVPARNPIADLLPGLICLSCQQQAWGSPFLARLNAGDETPGNVSYTQITSRYDQVVIPHTSGYLARGPRTTNVTVQDKCPWSLAEHLFIPADRAAIAIALDAFTRPGPARRDFRPAC
jgi:triacylglycerol esterase/lipase EstA (alpha/beta hydrolase family)